MKPSTTPAGNNEGSGLVAPHVGGLPEGVLASIPLANPDDAPSGMVAAFGSVWVENHRGQDLFRIDPKTDKVVADVDTTQDGCGEPVAALRRVWVGPCEGGIQTVGVDPRTNRVVTSVPGFNLNAVADGSGWLPSFSTHKLLRVDLSTGKVQAVLPAPGTDDVYARYLIWVANVDAAGNFNGQIDKLNPRTNQIVGTLHVPPIGASPWMTYSTGALWLKGIDSPKLERVETSNGSATIFHLPDWHPLAGLYDNYIEAARGSLWIRTSSSAISQIDPDTGRVVRRYPADPRGDGGYPLIAFGSLWISNFDTATVWRDRL